MPNTNPNRSLETSLYAAVKAHLERLGYEAKGEVCGCDIVAVRPGERPFLVITELKLGLTLDLSCKGSIASAAADEVWLAVRATRRGRDRDSRAHKLCRLLGFGLLAVDPSPALGRGPGRVGPIPATDEHEAPISPTERAPAPARDPTVGGASRRPS